MLFRINTQDITQSPFLKHVQKRSVLFCDMFLDNFLKLKREKNTKMFANFINF